jgi:hypothetical protein
MFQKAGEIGSDQSMPVQLELEVSASNREGMSGTVPFEEVSLSGAKCGEHRKSETRMSLAYPGDVCCLRCNA